MKKLKKFLITLAVVALASNFLLSIGNVGQSFDWGSAHDWGKAIGGFLSGGDKPLSFTNYEGGLATLSADGYDKSLTTSSDIKSFVLKIVNFALGFLGLMAVLIIIYAGVTYVTSAGVEEKTGNAKKMITYAAIGLLIVLGSFAFVNTIISSAIGGQGGTVSGGGTGKNYGAGFNAIAEEVKGLAFDIYNGYVFLSDSTEDFKNIQTDLNKDSLKETSLPTKSTITFFLNDVKSKLIDLKSKVGHLTDVEAHVNDKIRDIETEIDKINNIQDSEMNSYVKVDGGVVKYWAYEKGTKKGWQDFVNGMYEGATGRNVAADDGFTYLDGGMNLLKAWREFQSALKFDDIIPLLGKNFQAKLTDDLDRLKEIQDLVSSIGAIKDGDATTQYNTMMEKYNGLKLDVSSWTIDSKIEDTATNYLVPGLQANEKYYTSLLNLKFVNAVVHADMIQGNAPLSVILKAGESVDPAGGSIDGNNIIWDPAGTQSFEDVLKIPTLTNGKIDAASVDSRGKVDATDPNMIVPNSTDENVKVVTCDPPDSTNDQVDYKTARRCTFQKPGVYRAMVVVNSNDPKKYGPGISVVTIRVNPPTTKIELTMAVGDPNNPTRKETIMSYSDDIAVVDKGTIAVTEDQAKSLTFDAQKTSPTPLTYQWDFGNGNITDAKDSFKTVSKDNYKSFANGSYQVVLTVSNKSGIVDRKIFTLTIRPVVASPVSVDGSQDASLTVQSKPLGKNEGYINIPFTFNGSQSAAAKGKKIESYKWEVFYQGVDGTTPISKPENAEDNSREGPAKTKYAYTFKQIGVYTVRLTVTLEGGGADGSHSADITFRARSIDPKAGFTSAITDPTQPGTAHLLNASYDSDNKPEEMAYEWSVTSSADQSAAVGAASKDWEFVDGSKATDKNPTIKFNKKGDYDVKLKVTTQVGKQLVSDETSEITKKITVDNVLDIGWDTSKKQELTRKLTDEPGVSLSLETYNGVAYEIDYGDGSKDSGNIDRTENEQGVKKTFAPQTPHKYLQAGKYTIKVTVYDADDNSNTIQKRVIISPGDAPTSIASLSVNGQEILNNDETIQVTRVDKLIFSAAQSVNKDGTGRNLKYNWTFGYQNNGSSQKEAPYSYPELSPKDKGFYEAKLTVYDQDDPSKSSTDTLKIDVKPMAPSYLDLTATPQSGKSLVTPVVVNVQAVNPTDPDGKIMEYRWWYFDTSKPDEELGQQVTKDPQTQITIGANGESGQEKEYGFGLKIVDDDGTEFCNTEICKNSLNDTSTPFYPSIKVKNEQNDPPVAKFNVDKTQVNTGDEVTFTSSSTDSDDKIKTYIWDFDGNGFSDDMPVTDASVKHKYTKKNMDGYAVKLKVIDERGSENISDSTKVYVDAKAQNPKASFATEVVKDSGGKRIKFNNTSTADDSAGATLLGYTWDFGDSSATDANSSAKSAQNPEYTYAKNDTYNVKLTVVDSQGNTATTSRSIKVPLANPPTAKFTYTVNNLVVTFTDGSTADTAGGATIKSRKWDFDTNSALATADSDGNGVKDDDTDSSDPSTSYTYSLGGTYAVKLTVEDDVGNQSTITRNITVMPNGGSASGDSSTITTNLAGTQPIGLGVGIEQKNGLGIGTDTTGTTAGTGTVAPATPAPKLEANLSVSFKDLVTGVITNAIGSDGVVHVTSDKQRVVFDFHDTNGSYCLFDKNIYFNTNSTPDPADDFDKWTICGKFETSYSGLETQGAIAFKLVVKDIYGNEKVIIQPISFKK